MLKKALLILILGVLLFSQCGDDDYDADYDEEKIEFYYDDGKIIFQNNLEFPVILDHLRVNDIEVRNFFQYPVCDYVPYKDELVVDFRGKDNQVISLTIIVLPGKKASVSHKLKKGDEPEIIFYPVTYHFLSDNVYFINENISEQEKRYKLYLHSDIKNLKIETLENTEELDAIDGIMRFTTEYAALDDYLEDVEFELE